MAGLAVEGVLEGQIPLQHGTILQGQFVGHGRQVVLAVDLLGIRKRLAQLDIHNGIGLESGGQNSQDLSEGVKSGRWAGG